MAKPQHKYGIKTILKIIRGGIDCIKQSTNGLLSITSSLLASFHKSRRRDKVWGLILLLIWLILIVGYFFVPGFEVFEGRLIVQELSFTYDGADNKLFLNNLEHLKSVTFEGKQKSSLTLHGKFSSSNKSLNRQLSQLNKLTLELNNTTSYLHFAPSNSSHSNEISIIKLYLKPETQVNQLSYTSNNGNKHLRFCLQSSQEDFFYCLFPEADSSKSQEVSELELSLGQQPLTVTASTVNIPKLHIEYESDDFNELQFQFIPDPYQTEITFLSSAKFDLELSSVNDNYEAWDFSQWFRGDIDVKDVRFFRFDTTDNVRDELKISTILEGEVRMGSKIVKLKKNQFLIFFSEQPGIEKLRSILIHTKSPQGLETLIMGKSKGIGAGIYPKYPVETFRPTWLSKYIPPESFSAIVGFITAFTAILIPRLFSNNYIDLNHRKRRRKPRR